MQNKSHIKHLKTLVGEQILMHSIIVFSERCTLKKIKVNSTNIQVIKRNEVDNAVFNVCKRINVDVLGKEEIMQLYTKIYPYSQSDEQVKLQHINSIKKSK